MGWCRIGGRWLSGYQPDECRAAGGTYSHSDPGGGDRDTPPPNCFLSSIVTHSLAQTMLDVGVTYRAQVAFRDAVLTDSVFGQRMTKLYYEHNPALLAIARGNPVIVGRGIRMWMDVYTFVAAVVEAADPGDSKAACADSPLRFTDQTYTTLCDFFDELRSLSEDKALQLALYEVQTELKHFVGLSPEEALAKLRSKD